MISKEIVSLVVDEIYALCQKGQCTTAEISRRCKVSVAVVMDVINTLKDMRVLISEGHGRGHKYIWHVGKSKPNTFMLDEVYKRYAHAKDSKRKNNRVVSKKSSSIDSALIALAKAGFTGVISRVVKADGFRKVTETIDLSKIELGE